MAFPGGSAELATDKLQLESWLGRQRGIPRQWRAAVMLAGGRRQTIMIAPLQWLLLCVGPMQPVPPAGTHGQSLQSNIPTFDRDSTIQTKYPMAHWPARCFLLRGACLTVLQSL